MEINLNSNGFGNIGIGRDAPGANGIGAGVESKGADAKPVSRGAVTFTNAPAGLASAEPVADVSDAALNRDDALGKLVNSAFNLPPPPMPAFAD